uniref:cytochrome c oxidase subunit II n=1 Tax=Hydroptila angulata TaxID=1875522 RepID=UPI0022DCDE5C|nr:cytochrome c oxidase subunit II [Hydroptila angulata]UZZ44041.1 cytochrome c oxidase subunit II [Hydroptila angulata]
MNTWSSLNFQNSASPLMEQLIFFHDHAMITLIIITIFIAYYLSTMILNKLINLNILANQSLELIWTIIPSFFLIFIGVPSLNLLYLIDEINKPKINLKTMGHQWFWSYEYSNFLNINFDSYMAPFSSSNDFRLLEVDNRIILPLNMNIRMLISSSDVIHSWTIPCLGIKMDAMPGRMNQSTLYINRPGVYFGQCSEICGNNHSFMPIVIEGIKMNFFIKWLKNFN